MKVEGLLFSNMFSIKNDTNYYCVLIKINNKLKYRIIQKRICDIFLRFFIPPYPKVQTIINEEPSIR